MDPQRQRYLDAMGVQRWVPRVEAIETECGEAQAQPTLSPSQEPGASQLLDLALTPTLSRGESEARGREPEGGSGLAFGTASTLPDWEALQAQVAACTACPLHQTRPQTVFGVGNRRADWLVIGEAPGEQEDLQGEPFVGRAGQLLNEMLRAVGQSRETAYIANILKCRPPGNRDPKPEEAAACSSYLQRQVAWTQPRIILAVGRIAAQNLLNTDTPVGKLRGRVHRYGDIPLVVVYHPAYLLRSLTEKRKAWDDLRLALNTYRDAKAAQHEA